MESSSSHRRLLLSLLCFFTGFASVVFGRSSHIHEYSGTSCGNYGSQNKHISPFSHKDFLAVMANHPALISHRLRKSFDRLVKNPSLILKTGFQKIPGNQEHYKKVLSYIFRNSYVESVSFGRFLPDDLREGKLQKLTVAIRDVSLGLFSFRRLILSFSGIHFDVEKILHGHFYLTEIGSYSFSGEITQDVVRQMAGGNVSVSISNSEILFVTSVRVAFVHLTAKLRGTLYVKDGESICFKIDSLNLGNLPFAEFLGSRIARGLNPLFSLDRYMGKARTISTVELTYVNLHDKVIEIGGSGSILLLD